MSSTDKLSPLTIPKGATQKTWVLAYVGLGSNLATPIQQVRNALVELDSIPETHCVARSGLYRSPPMGRQDQPDFINAVAALRTSLSALYLLEQLQSIEHDHGRKRGPIRWGPRTLDLDILLYGQQIVRHPRLLVPHPGMHERAFVLYPLWEIAPELAIPGRGRLADLLIRYPAGELEHVQE